MKTNDALGSCNKLACLVALLVSLALTCHATTLMPPIEEAQARASADVVADAKVLSIAPVIENGLPQSRESIISIEILTRGVSAKTNATVLWNQALADATLARKAPPDVGQKYRVHLRLQWRGTNTDFEPIHPDWGFVHSKNTLAQPEPTFLEHTMQRGDTLWSIAAHYYGNGARWRVLQAANFTNDAALGVYRLTSGMRLYIPTFPTNSPSRDGAAKRKQVDSKH